MRAMFCAKQMLWYKQQQVASGCFEGMEKMLEICRKCKILGNSQILLPSILGGFQKIVFVALVHFSQCTSSSWRGWC